MASSPPRPAPCGTWRSPIHAHLLAEESIGLGSIRVDGDELYWLESRPAEQGRLVVVRRNPGGEIAEVLSAPFSARTRVHEYGGGAYAVAGGTLWFSNLADARLHRADLRGDDTTPHPITPEGRQRYADLVVDAHRERLVCVREDHETPALSLTAGQEARPPEPQNSIVAVPWDADELRIARVLVHGSDFYAAPRIDPAGERLCWLQWNHPNMPWDGCELWVGRFDATGDVVDARLVAGGHNESVYQPEWSPDGVLHFVSDRSGWWNLYRAGEGEDGEPTATPLTTEHAELGAPMWTLAQSMYGFFDAQRIACTVNQGGSMSLRILDVGSGELRPLDLPYTYIAPSLRTMRGRVVMVAASPTEPSALVEVDADTAAVTVVRRSIETRIDPVYVSLPQPVSYPTESGHLAHALHYAPTNPEFAVPDGERPPLLVRTHGGPTSQCIPALDLEVQFWTSRGIAVLDVDYAGSTGYGRDYRLRLEGNWGIADVDDCVAGALHLAEQGLADRDRLLIDGASAGGFTTLCALTFRDVFAAGASWFGVADLERLAIDTHKFESRYLDRLVGPYPAMRDVYLQRSPVHHAERLSRPVILFQGLEDRVVPPSQAEVMVDAVRAHGVPCAYVAFEGEDHGFRRADSIVRAHENELGFYAQVLGFHPADALEPLAVENLRRR